MKRRFSIKKAEWSAIREEEYKKYCDDILYQRNLKLSIDGDKVYLLLPDKETFLVEVDKPERIWYEIWLKLRNYKF